MKFWQATANIERIEQCVSYGIFRGVITNPHVAPKAYYQLHSASEDTMLRDADDMLSIDPDRILLKVPATIEGLSVIGKLSSQGLSVMATAVPTTVWLTYVQAVGASAVAPYSGMLQRRNIYAKMEGVPKMQELIDRQSYSIDLCVGIYSRY